MTRNNKNGTVGFVAMPNRANVLLSRAQHGMYIVGNSDTFRRSSTKNKQKGIWAQARALHDSLLLPSLPCNPIHSLSNKRSAASSAHCLP